MNESAPDPGGLTEPQAEIPLSEPQGVVIPPEILARSPGESVLVPLAQNMVTQLVDGAKWSRSSIVTLNKTILTLRKVIAALIVLFAVVGSIVGYLLDENITHALGTQLQRQAQTQAAEIKALEAYVQSYAQHGCSALGLLTARPVAAPPDPAANPSREVTYEFYEALLYWERADGCKPAAG